MLPRVSVVRRLEETIKHGYVERVGNADKVNIPDLQKKLQKTLGFVRPISAVANGILSRQGVTLPSPGI